jgi:flagellar basal body-associated protein FliL
MYGLYSMFAVAVRNCTGGDPKNCDINLPAVSADANALKIILQIVFGVVGSLAVLFVVIGGFKFVLSNGDPNETKKARETIQYAVIGLVLALSAEVIVSFVIKSI